ncbi:uncharacterized protein LOC115634461 [Scaptodrosophila lebanonensis]|uniref:Uncharacterized protein LOC115634461 n=1 Tax=Drosophila lebanonensis TaxID=7225 RepID=A0A6J2UHY1_DROLE|nr:uncharacterized protein LOC115634461 [Scaptodrosophila lebanonensis]
MPARKRKAGNAAEPVGNVPDNFEVEVGSDDTDEELMNFLFNGSFLDSKKNPTGEGQSKENGNLDIEPEEVIPNKFLIGGVVVNFGSKDDEPDSKDTVRVIELPSKTKSKKSRKRSSNKRRKEKHASKIDDLFETPELKLPPEHQWLMDKNFRPISPLPDNVALDLPSSEEIWKNYEALQRGAKDDEIMWPISLIQKNRDDNVQNENNAIEPQMVEEQVNESETEDMEIETLNEIENLSMNWPMKLQENLQQFEESNCNIINTGSLELGLDEERTMAEWIKSELLNEPLSDIEEFDVLLSMARNQEQNGAALYELLRPKLQTAGPLKEVRKCPPKALVSFFEEQSKSAQQKPPLQPANVSSKQIPPAGNPTIVPVNVQGPTQRSGAAVKSIDKTVLNNWKQNKCAESSSTVDGTTVVKDSPKEQTAIALPKLVEVQQHIEKPEEVPSPFPTETKLNLNSDNPVPQSEEIAISNWLQQCEQAISQQLQTQWQQVVKASDPKTSPEESSSSSAIDFEREITTLNQHKLPGTQETQTGTINDDKWLGSYQNMLHSMDDTIDSKAREFRDPQLKRLRSKQVVNIKRSLLMPALPLHLEQQPEQGPQQIRIMRPIRRRCDRDTLDIEIKYVRMFCTFELNRELDLKMTVKKLDDAVYNSDIDVIEKHYGSTQMAWIWPNGSVMIINGRSQAALRQARIQLSDRLVGAGHYGVNSISNLQQYRLMSWANYPWRIDVYGLCEAYALTTEPRCGSSRFMYFVDKSFPAVAARVYETGMVHVFAMTIVLADEMLAKLYLITANFRAPDKKKKPNQPGPDEIQEDDALEQCTV